MAAKNNENHKNMQSYDRYANKYRPGLSRSMSLQTLELIVQAVFLLERKQTHRHTDKHTEKLTDATALSACDTANAGWESGRKKYAIYLSRNLSETI